MKTCLGFALLRDEKGEEMHKSKGNAIWFDEAAERAGVDVMRWLYLKHNPAQNLNFGWRLLDEVRRTFLLPLWNSYAFFANYARLDGFHPAQHDVPLGERTLLDRWILARLQQVIATVRERIQDYDSMNAARSLQDFVVEDLSNWYIRRNRRRFWKTESDQDKAAAYLTLYEVLVTLTKLLAPFIPFTTELMYQNLVRRVDPQAPESVHLTDYPEADLTKLDDELVADMNWLLRAVELGRAARNKASIKVRQPLPRAVVAARDPAARRAIERLVNQFMDELNVKAVEFADRPEDYLSYRVKPNLPVLGPRLGPKLPVLQRALAGIDQNALARQLRAGRSVTLTLDGEELEFGSDDFLVEPVDRLGFAAFEDRDLLVAVDLTITPELRLEGLARDFIRGVQEARKNAGFEIDETIEIVYRAEDELAAAVERFADSIKHETLAVDLRAGEPEREDGHVEEVKVGRERFVVALRRVGRLAEARR